MSNKTDLDAQTDAARLEAVGRALFGENWKRPLASACDVSHVAFVRVSGKNSGRRLSPAVRKAVADYVDAQATQVVEQARVRSAALTEAALYFREPTEKADDG